MRFLRWQRADLLFAGLAGILCFSRFRFGLAPLATYDDDFFYYLQVAVQLGRTGRSTFDGTHLANGYHPLWLLVIASLHALAPPGWFFVALECLEFVLALTTYFLLKRLLLQTLRGQVAVLSAAVIATLCAALGRGGMEVGLLFPCAAAVLAYRLRAAFVWSRAQAAIYGFLLSVLVLSRLDTAILVG